MAVIAHIVKDVDLLARLFRAEVESDGQLSLVYSCSAILALIECE